ncbi:uncharacterized protein LOC132164990 [Corylus avellana]|uniref:uncharacterized protein LOC132164990 n=1 Tax=Corylus avellana TaxID=13451 RepID=UPI00286C8D69|nr:uncharacterized protein LOC132164990 [Corylus avellana]
MAIVLRFVDKNGFVRERFFGHVHVSHTATLTFKGWRNRYEELRVAQASENAYMITIDDIESGRGLNQIRKDPNSFHRVVERLYEDLRNQSQHIQNVFENFTSEQIANNRLQLKASINVDRKLAFQSVAFRGQVKSMSSTNHENFLEIQYEELRVTQAAENAYMIAIDDIESGRRLNQISHRSSMSSIAIQISRHFKCMHLVSSIKRTGKSTIYQLVFRVVVLLLTLPVSTTTTEPAFSAMNIIKTRLRNKIEDEFLTDSLMLYIEKEIAATLSIDPIIDDFQDMKTQRVPF